MAAETEIREDGEAGFTLVEMLVALALLALIAVFIGQGIVSVRQMTSVAARMDNESEMAAVRDHLRRTIGEAVIDLPLTGSAAFLGEPGAMRFTAPADPLLEAGGLNEITIRLEPSGRLEPPGANTFDLVERRRVMSGIASGDGIPTVLLTGLRSLRLRYAEAGADGQLRWLDTWQGKGNVPLLVALDLGFPRNDRRRFPELLAHPFASPVPPERQAAVTP